MASHDVLVVGGGISGLSLAWKAAQDGKRVLVLEKSARLGGCLHSERTADGYWFELGAHTTYNSYGGLPRRGGRRRRGRAGRASGGRPGPAWACSPTASTAG